MSSVIRAIRHLRELEQLPASGDVSVNYLLQRFQPSPPDSVRALLLDIHAPGDIGMGFCGTPDPDSSGVIHPQTFGSPGGRWSRTRLSFSINPTGCKGLTAADAIVTITQAFGLWMAAVPLITFQPVMTNGDIQVAFAGKDVDKRFGSPGGTMGVGQYPERGRLFFDSIENWSPETLLVVAVHEIGHTLGLSHSNVRTSIMYPYALQPMIAQANAGTLAVDAESADALRNMYGWSPQKPLTDRGTSDRPALGIMSITDLAGTRSSLYMLWKGVSYDPTFWWSQLNGDEWTPQEGINFPGFYSSHSPSLTTVPVPQVDTLKFGLFMAWKGPGDESALYWSINDGSGWQPRKLVENVGTSRRPAIAYFAGQVYMAWRGVDDSNIYWSTFNGTDWSPQRPILGIGTSESPTLVVFGDRLHMFWKGVEDDANAYYSTLDNNEDPIWNAQQRISYIEARADGMVGHNIGTSNALSACVHANRIIIAWKGVEDDSTIYFSLYDGKEYTGQIGIPNAGTSVGPNVVDFNGQIHMVWKGIEDDSNIYWSRL